MEKKLRSLFQYVFFCIGSYIFDNQKWDSTLKIVHGGFNAIFANLSFFFITGGIITSYTEEDIEVWIGNVSIWLSTLVTYTGHGTFWLFRKQLQKLLEEISFKDAILDIPFVDHVTKYSNEKGKLKELKNLVFDTQQKVHKYTFWLLRGYSATVVITWFLYVVDTLRKIIFREDESLRLIAFSMWIPWKLDGFHVYVATFILNSYIGFFCAMCIPCFLSIIVLLMGQIIRHLRILTYILANLDELIVEIIQNRNETWLLYCTSVLSQCINHYVYIKKFCYGLNAISRYFYLIVILGSIVCVCVCSIMIVFHGLSPILIKFFLHEIIFILMVLLFCLLGQQVQNECEKLEYAVTEKWYMFNRKHQINVKIFHLAILQMMPIYIYGSIPLSMSTFSWYIKTAMSYSTIVLSLIEK